MPSAEPRLTILTVIAPHRYSGAERIAVTLADGLRARGHRVVFACKHEPVFCAELRRRGLECLTERVSGKVSPLSLWRVVSAARAVRADVIHTHLSTGAWWGSFAGRLLGIPVLAHVHALNTKTCFMLADLLACCSEGVRRHMVAQGIPPERVRVVYNGIDLAQLRRLRPLEEVRRELGLRDGEPVIGVAAHLSPKKGQRHVIEATALLRQRRPGIVCYLIGEGHQRGELMRLAEKLGVSGQVRFLGFRQDAVDLMQVMDAVILPSVAKEGLGLCLLEAQALGKAVVGSDIPGIDEAVVREQTGLLVAPGDAAALAAAVERLLADPALRARLGEAGRRRMTECFTLERMVEQTEQLYYELVEKRGAKRTSAPGA